MEKNILVVRDRLPDGTFGPPRKAFVEVGETQEEKIARLELEAALLAYDNMQKEIEITNQDNRIGELETSQALLTYQLMTGGII